MDMVERVAVALCVRNIPSGGNRAAWLEEQWRHYLPDARAAIAAMRTPTEAMLATAVQQVGDPSPENWAAAEAVCAGLSGPHMEGETAVAELARDWNTMIATALGED